MRKRKRVGCIGKLVFLLLLACVVAIVVIRYISPDKMNDFVLNYKRMLQKDKNFETITLDSKELEGCFYFNQLSEKGQLVYKEILQGVKQMKTQIQVHSGDSGQIGKIYQKVLYDSPELFWCEGGITTTSYSDYSLISPNYNCSNDEKNTKQQEIDSAIALCLNEAPNEGSAYDKIKYVYEYIVNHTDYQLDCADSQNIYSVFVNGISVCAGYSKATQILLQKLGVACIYVVGNTVETGQSHAWNLVKIDNHYYHVDTTWGDPVFMMQEENIQNVSNISYDYLCSDDQSVSKTHTWDSSLGLPACTSNEYNYYILNHCYYESFDPEVILKAMNDTIYAGGSQTIFKFANDELYRQAKEEILGDLASKAMQNLMEAYGLSTVSCGQMVEDSLDKIVIYWNYHS